MNITFKYYGPAFLWALFILVMCSIKLGEVSSAPMFFPGFDKLVHCGFFFVLVVFGALGFIRQQTPRNISYKSLLIITVVIIGYGSLIEILQRYIFTWRSGEWDDLFADMIGALMGCFGIIVTVKAMNYEKQ